MARTWISATMADLDLAAAPEGVRPEVRDWLGRLLRAVEWDAVPKGMTIATGVIIGGGAAMTFSLGGRNLSIVVPEPCVLQMGWSRWGAKKIGSTVVRSNHAGEFKNALWWLIDGRTRAQLKLKPDDECRGKGDD